MNRLFSNLIWVLIFLSAPYAAAQIRLNDAEIKSILQERIDISQRGVGLVVGVIDAEGSRVIAHGRMSRGGDQEPDGNTAFEIGSITKVFTALLLADMAERGELNLEDPVAKLLPEPVQVPARNGREMTLLDLATHRSGLPRDPENLDPQDLSNPFADYTVEQMYEFLSDYALIRDVGAQFEYSNLGIGLLGHVLSLAAGMDYETLLTTRITGPLEMDDTAIELSSDLQSRLAPGHDFGGNPVSNFDLPMLAGAGALRSTVHDMLKFLAANMGLSESDLTPVMEKTHAFQNDTELPGLDIGLAWFILDVTGTEILWHDGLTGGYRSFAGFDKNGQIGVVVLSNSTHDISDIGLHLLDARFPLADLGPLPVAVEVDPVVYDAYVGEYELVPDFVLSVTKEGDGLYVQATGQLKFEVFPESETEFFYTVVEAQITFVKNAEGEVTHLVLHQNGVDQRAERLPGTGTAVLEEYAVTRPSDFVLEQNYPNPFNSGTAIRFSLPKSGEVELVIYSLSGQRVAILVEDARSAGVYTVHWDGRDNDGRQLATGTYFYLLKTSSGEMQRRKLVLLR